MELNTIPRPSPAGWVLRRASAALVAMVATVVASAPVVVTAGEAAADSAARTARATLAPSARRPEVGIASVYARMLHGRETASGEPHDSDELTAAHRTLPLGTEVRVTNLRNQRSVLVRINDRGPAVGSRIIDLSPRAAAAIGLRAKGRGLARVQVEIMRDAPVKAAEAGKDNSASKFDMPAGVHTDAGSKPR